MVGAARRDQTIVASERRVNGVFLQCRVTTALGTARISADMAHLVSALVIITARLLPERP